MMEASMSLRSKRELFEAVKGRYHRADKSGRGSILTEFSANAGITRKYAIRLLNSGYRRGRKRPGPKPRYQGDVEFLGVLRQLWKLFHYPSGKVLKPQIPALMRFYALHHGAVSAAVQEKLLSVSSATIDRVLRGYKRLGKGTTKPGSLLRIEIPVQGSVWQQGIPGFVEADTVAHCGMSTAGVYVNTVTLTDIATAWTVVRAMFGKSAESTLECIREMQTKFPFPIQGFDSDNGSEFLNHHLVRYMAERNIRFTRSRPYRKNDNAHVEQKNYSFVRQLMGYNRFENPELVPVMNEIYENWCLLKNFFIPTMKLVEKRRVGAKIIKKHDAPTTPYQRVLNSVHVSDDVKRTLIKQYEALDPFVLKKRVDDLARKIPPLAKVSFQEWKRATTPEAH